MKTIINIFEKDGLRISCYEDLINESKSIQVHVVATNPNDGEEYTRHSGWLSKTLALHGTANTRGYAYDAAIEKIAKYKKEIRDALIEIGRKLEDTDNAGLGVTNNISHPHGESQRRNVRKIMQKNAPQGTNHM